MSSALRFCLALLLVLLMVPSAGRAEQETHAQIVPDEVLEKLQAAAIQHESIALLLEEQKFQAVIPELKSIFDLGLPQSYEVYQVQEVQVVAQRLREKRQFSIAHSVVELGLKYLQGDRSRASLYLLKSQLYRDNAQIREATEATELAKKLYQNSLKGARTQ